MATPEKLQSELLETAPIGLRLMPKESTQAEPKGLTLEEQLSLCEANIEYIRAIAAKLKGRGMEFEDLVQEGYIGLMQAASRYDPDKNGNFMAYAQKRISGAMLDAIRENSPLSRFEQSKLNSLLGAESALTQQLQRQPTAEELAGAMAIDVDEVNIIRKLYLRYLSASLDQPMSERRFAEDESLAPMEVLPDPHSVCEDDIIQSLVSSMMTDVIYKKLLFVTDKERRVLWGIRDGLSQREISEQLGVTESYISLIKSSLFKKLRSEFRKYENRHLIEGKAVEKA